MSVMKFLCDATEDDAASLVRMRFGGDSISLLQKVLKNPLLSRCGEYGAGDIAYENDKPACFQAAIIRRLFYGRDEIYAVAKGMTCSSFTATEAPYIDVRLASERLRGGARFSFCNSANEKSALIGRKDKKNILGPESCSMILWRAVRPVRCLAYFVWRKIFKFDIPSWWKFDGRVVKEYAKHIGEKSLFIISDAHVDFFDRLMKRYLEHNRGLVCSRSTEEIDWIFGQEVSSGAIVILAIQDSQGPLGYIALKQSLGGRRWRICDMIVVDNDNTIIDLLVKETCEFIKIKTPAIIFEVSGFPERIQPLFRRYFTHVRQMGFNQFIVRTRDKEFRAKLREMIFSDKSWFFGPYDGDECM